MKSIERKVTEEVFAHHAELCTELDWQKLENGCKSGQEIGEFTFEPQGPHQSTIIVTLTILYWSLRIAGLALDRIEKKQKVTNEEIAEEIEKELDSELPETVRTQVLVIVFNTREAAESSATNE